MSEIQDVRVVTFCVISSDPEDSRKKIVAMMEAGAYDGRDSQIVDTKLLFRIPKQGARRK